MLNSATASVLQDFFDKTNPGATMEALNLTRNVPAFSFRSLSLASSFVMYPANQLHEKKKKKNEKRKGKHMIHTRNVQL